MDFNPAGFLGFQAVADTARIIEGHLEGTLAYWTQGLTTAYMKGLNSLFSTVKLETRGYRTVGRPPRRQHKIDAILQGHRLSGLSLLAFARKHDLRCAALRWRRRAGTRASENPKAPASFLTPTFIRIQLKPLASGGEFVRNRSYGQTR